MCLFCGHIKTILHLDGSSGKGSSCESCSEVRAWPRAQRAAGCQSTGMHIGTSRRNPGMSCFRNKLLTHQHKTQVDTDLPRSCQRRTRSCFHPSAGAEMRLEPSINKLMEGLCFRAEALQISAGTSQLSAPAQMNVQLAGQLQGQALPTPFWDTTAGLPRFFGVPYATSWSRAVLQHVCRNNLLCPPRGPDPRVQLAPGIPSCHPCQCS